MWTPSYRWRYLATSLALFACDRGVGARGAAGTDAAPTGGASATVPPRERAPLTSQSRPRWPAPAALAEPSAFTAGLAETPPTAASAALLTDVRAARHDGFDRVVFELDDRSAPGYHVEYVDKPVRRCGSGETTAIAGDAWLEVRLEPSNAHTEAGAPTIADRERSLNLEIVQELEQTCDFEAVVTWVVGVKRPNPYRVSTLNDPLRLVVDIKH